MRLASPVEQSFRPTEFGLRFASRKGVDPTFDQTGQRAGGARLLAVVERADPRRGNNYRLPSLSDYAAVWGARQLLTQLELESIDANPDRGTFRTAPDGTRKGGVGFRVLLYGISTFGELFSVRQRLVLLTILKHLPPGVSGMEPARTMLAFALDRVAMSGMSLTRGIPTLRRCSTPLGGKRCLWCGISPRSSPLKLARDPGWERPNSSQR